MKPARRLRVHQQDGGRSPMASAFGGGRHEFVRIHLPCNQDCLFCSVVYSAEDEAQKAEEALARIDALGRDGVDCVTVTGGEPTIHPRFVEALLRARAAGVPRVIVESNATRAGEGGLAARVREAHPGASFFVSLHSHRPEVSDLITEDAGGFERTLAGLDALAAAGVPVTLNHVLNRLNAAELPAFVDLVADRIAFAGHVTLSFVAAINRARDHAWIIPAVRDVRPHLRAGIRRAEERGVRVRIPDRCGVPPCIVPEATALHDTLTVPEETVVPITSDRHKAERCRDCALDRRCLGLWRGYVELHGDAELRPLARSGDGFAPIDDVELAPAEPIAPLPPAAALDGAALDAYRAGQKRSRTKRLLAEAVFHREAGRPEPALRAAHAALGEDASDPDARSLFTALTSETHVPRALEMIEHGALDDARDVLRFVLSIDREHPSALRAWKLLDARRRAR